MTYQWSYGNILKAVDKVTPADRPALIHGKHIISHGKVCPGGIAPACADDSTVHRFPSFLFLNAVLMTASRSANTARET